MSHRLAKPTRKTPPHAFVLEALASLEPEDQLSAYRVDLLHWFESWRRSF
jgi:hypothetical protein